MATPAGLVVSPDYLASLPDGARAAHAEFFRRAAELPWIPAAWSAEVAALIAARPGDYLHPLPAFDFSGRKVDGLPTWLDTPERVAAWQMLVKHEQETLRHLVASWGKLQAGVYASRMREKARWDRIRDAAISVATVIRDAPRTVVGAAGGLASDLATTALARFLPALLIGAAGLVAFVAARSYLKKGK